ncbi:MAG: HAD family hydrolase [Burkholderiales bacterium]|nr:HAD family hydrolase [Burkholderiales bacterium]
MRSGFKAIIFDYEGTLVDFQWKLAPAEDELRQACAALGCPTQGSYAELWNAAVAASRPAGRLEDVQRTLQPIYDRFDADAATRWAPRPGAEALLAELAARNIATALVSNCGRSAVTAVLSRFGLDAHLQPVICRGDVHFMKPHPEGTKRALDALGIAPHEALFVGDSRTDVHTARAAGVPVAVIRGGECDEAAFVDLPPDYWVHALGDLLALVP